jgi:hypothetical protein
VLVASFAATPPDAHVWLWRMQRPGEPSDWIDVTGSVTPAGHDGGYRIAFRDFSADRTFQRWVQGDTKPPANLTLHRHDNGFGIEIAPEQAARSQFAVIFGSPGAALYAVRLGR